MKKEVNSRRKSTRISNAKWLLVRICAPCLAYSSLFRVMNDADAAKDEGIDEGEGIHRM